MNQEFDLRELRNAFGTFMTGVTVITTHETGGLPRGFTANSFCSVSLDPPLVSVCIGKSAESVDVFSEGPGFAINVLAESQIEISNLFASKRIDKFDLTSWNDGPLGNPVLQGVCAWFDCEKEQLIDAGDHVIVIGRVRAYDYNDQNGLGYAKGGYVTLGLEQAAVDAASQSSGVIVGALVEADGKLLLEKDEISGRYQPIASGLGKEQGSIGRLTTKLNALNIGVSVNSLFAVFESDDAAKHYIYYRATAERQDEATFFAAEDIPWDQLASNAIRIMLERYLSESQSQRYGIYFGNEESGTVKATLSESAALES